MKPQTKTQYDDVGEAYQSINGMAHNKYSLDPSFIQLLGNVKGKSVLDLACGTGHYTRRVRDLGAVLVDGVDISGRMIEVARAIQKVSRFRIFDQLSTKYPNENIDELSSRLRKIAGPGIKYHQYDVAEMPKLGEFDIVTGAWLLKYAPTRKALEAMCQNIANNLKEGGRFIGINDNPLSPTGRFESEKTGEGVIMERIGPAKDGGVIRGVLYTGKDRVVFESYAWTKKTYEEAFRKAGLVNVQWHVPRVSKEGIKKLKLEYWSEYFKKNNTAVLIEAEKD